MHHEPKSPSEVGDLLATAFAEAGSRLGRRDIMLMLEAAEDRQLSQEDFARLVVSAGGVDSLAALDRAGWERIMDVLIAAGYRHPEIPMLSAGQIALIEDSRRALGIDPIAFSAAMRERGAAELPHRLDGWGFRQAMQWLVDHGHAGAYPETNYVSRTVAATLRATWYWSGLTERDWFRLLVELGGGVPRLRFLDQRQVLRMVAWFGLYSFRAPDPAPHVNGEPGFITQPQANLVWKLWNELGGLDGDCSEAALDRALATDLGLEGGLPTLTQRGVGLILDRQLELAISRREAAETTFAAKLQ